MKKYFARLAVAINLVTISLIGSMSLAVLQPAYAASTCTDNQIELSAPLLNGQKCLDKNAPGGPIFAYLRMVIQFLSGAVGLVVVLMIVIGGVQYITSAGNASQVKAARDRITNAITGLILFALMFAILNFLIPGGIIG